jgi:neutral trehalase
MFSSLLDAEQLKPRSILGHKLRSLHKPGSNCVCPTAGDLRRQRLNRVWSEEGGNFSYRKSPVMFYMMAAGIPSPEQAHRLVYEHLLNPKEFGGENVLPSISRDDPAFPEQYYWRGTIWPPMNYFTYEGLTRYGHDDLATELAEKTLRLVKKNWDSTGALWDDYNSITGEGNSHGAGVYEALLVERGATPACNHGFGGHRHLARRLTFRLIGRDATKPSLRTPNSRLPV